MARDTERFSEIKQPRRSSRLSDRTPRPWAGRDTLPGRLSLHVQRWILSTEERIAALEQLPFRISFERHFPLLTKLLDQAIGQERLYLTVAKIIAVQQSANQPLYPLPPQLTEQLWHKTNFFTGDPFNEARTYGLLNLLQGNRNLISLLHRIHRAIEALPIGSKAQQETIQLCRQELIQLVNLITILVEPSSNHRYRLRLLNYPEDSGVAQAEVIVPPLLDEAGANQPAGIVIRALYNIGRQVYHHDHDPAEFKTTVASQEVLAEYKIDIRFTLLAERDPKDIKRLVRQLNDDVAALPHLNRFFRMRIALDQQNPSGQAYLYVAIQPLVFQDVDRPRQTSQPDNRWQTAFWLRERLTVFFKMVEKSGYFVKMPPEYFIPTTDTVQTPQKEGIEIA